MAKYPAFLFYPEDFAAGTLDMSPAEVGIYIRCLCYQWHKASVPDCIIKVGRIAGASPDEMRSAWPAVREKFTACGNGTLRNERLEKVRKSLDKRSELRAAAGRAGAEARWTRQSTDDNAMANDMANAMANDMANAMANTTQKIARRLGNGNRNRNGSEDEDENGFDQFWEVYPPGRKKSKKAARVAWDKAIKRADPQVILSAAIEYAGSSEGLGQFVKMPSTWLNNDCWEDDRAAWQDPRAKLTEKNAKTVEAGQRWLAGKSDQGDIFQ